MDIIDELKAIVAAGQTAPSTPPGKLLALIDLSVENTREADRCQVHPIKNIL